MHTSNPPNARKILEKMSADLERQSAAIAEICDILEVQFKRIAAMQAELDVLPTARAGRKIARMRPPQAAHNGNGAGKP